MSQYCSVSDLVIRHGRTDASVSSPLSSSESCCADLTQDAMQCHQQLRQSSILPQFPLETLQPMIYSLVFTHGLSDLYRQHCSAHPSRWTGSMRTSERHKNEKEKKVPPVYQPTSAHSCFVSLHYLDRREMLAAFTLPSPSFTVSIPRQM